jgi:hypothetical protein
VSFDAIKYTNVEADTLLTSTAEELGGLIEGTRIN